MVDGNVAIDGGAFTVIGTGVAYRDFVARLRFDQNRVEIGDFSIADKNGRTLRVAGGVNLAKTGSARSFDVTFMTDGFAVLDNEMGTVRVDAIVTAQGDFASPRLSGEVRVVEGRLDVGRVLEITTSDLYSTTPLEPGDDAAAPPIEGAGDQVAKAVDAAAAPAETKSPLLSRVDLNLNVRLPDNFVMRGRDLRTGRSSMGLGDMNIIAGGDLHIRKTPNAPPSLVGNLQIIRGYYSFQGRRFDVRPESLVTFRGQTPIDPALNVTADRQVSGVTASVEVRGSMREPEVNLSSQPPLDDADLLALIIFGQPVNDLGASAARLTLRAGSHDGRRRHRDANHRFGRTRPQPRLVRDSVAGRRGRDRLAWHANRHASLCGCQSAGGSRRQQLTVDRISHRQFPASRHATSCTAPWTRTRPSGSNRAGRT